MLTATQCRAEVLARCPTAVHRHIYVLEATEEDRRFSRFIKLVDGKSGYVDLTDATDEERSAYEEHCRSLNERVPEKALHCIVQSERAGNHLDFTTLKTRSAILGSSSASEEAAWRNAWCALKRGEDLVRRTKNIFVVIVLLGLTAVAFIVLY